MTTYRTWGRGRGLRLAGPAYEEGLPVHVVVGTVRRRPIFARHEVAIAVFEAVRSEEVTLAACLMPDHLHWLLRHGRDLARTVGRFKSYGTRCAWRAGHRGRLWQRSFHDHALRRSEAVPRVVEYLAGNPVRAGLVGAVGEWPFFVVAWTDGTGAERERGAPT
jgi:REP element-mobilizing transposase RayT